MFTQRHYQAIAEVLRANQPEKPVLYEPPKDRLARQICKEYHRRVVDQLAVMFARNNPRFDWDKFITAATRPE